MNQKENNNEERGRPQSFCNELYYVSTQFFQFFAASAQTPVVNSKPAAREWLRAQSMPHSSEM